MSDPNNSGEKSEKASPKKLRDARKQGNVAISQDLTQTVTTIVWLVMLIALSGYHGERITEFTNLCWSATQVGSVAEMAELGRRGAELLLVLSIIPLGLVACIGVLSDFVQVGPIFSFERISPNPALLNPIEGIKRVFAARNWFDTAKSLVKTGLIVTITTILLIEYLPDILLVSLAEPKMYAHANQRLLVNLSAWVAATFVVIALGDWLFQKYDYLKRLRMSKQDLRQERKSQDGDPQLRSQRRRMQRQWATGSAKQAVKNASALVVNPTHIAVALEYDPETTVVPRVTATGEGNLAKIMREVAERESIPIMRSIPLARKLYYVCEEEEFVPEELFDAVAEVLAWADSVRRKVGEREERDQFREADSGFDGMVS